MNQGSSTDRKQAMKKNEVYSSGIKLPSLTDREVVKKLMQRHDKAPKVMVVENFCLT